MKHHCKKIGRVKHSWCHRPKKCHHPPVHHSSSVCHPTQRCHPSQRCHQTQVCHQTQICHPPVWQPPPPHPPHPPHEPSQEVEPVLKCGTSVGSVPLTCFHCTNDVDIHSNNNHPVVLGTVSLDTSHLINPTVKIDFSSLISFQNEFDYTPGFYLRLVFQLTRTCHGSPPITLGTWVFEKCSQRKGYDPHCHPKHGDFEMVTDTESFNFSWCECEDCPACCSYSVEIVEQQCYDLEFAALSNISISAQAVGIKRHHKVHPR